MTDTKRHGDPVDPPGDDRLGDALRRMVVPRSSASGARGGGGRAPEGDVAVAVRSGVGYSLPDRPEPPPVPNGWYAIAGSGDLDPGQILSTIAVGRELVAYRDASGDAHVVDAHCPHLGAHLGGGVVEGDTISCPYHGWRFGPDGACVEIPYSDAQIPTKACIRTYPVSEQDGFVLFWYHAAGRPPTYQVPRVDEVADAGWSDAYPFRFELVAALQEMAENNVDYAHLRYVHGRAVVPNDTSTFTTDGPFSTVVEKLPDGQEFFRHAWGPGVAILRVTNLMTVLTTTTPIDRRHCRMLWHFHFRGEIEDMADDLIEGVTGEFGLMADVPIWRDKIFLERPLLVKADGNIAEFRRWYSQFYES